MYSLSCIALTLRLLLQIRRISKRGEINSVIKKVIVFRRMNKYDYKIQFLSNNLLVFKHSYECCQMNTIC